jgi:hypothetical protein
MNLMTHTVYPCMLVVALAALSDVRAGSPPAGHTSALIICGISKDPNERLLKNGVVNDWRTYLLDQAGVEPNRLAMLAPDGTSSRGAAGISTAESIKKTLDAFAATTGPADQFILYYAGQANAVAGKLRFNLPGPDITHEDLAGWLGSVKAGTQLVILDCPCAAAAAKALAGQGRIVLCASGESQAYATRFGAHFVPALAHVQNDTNHDGRVSLLEAFTAAAREMELWYQQRQLLPTETPCLEDDGDGVPSERPWRYQTDGGDGRRAVELFLAATGRSHDG